MKSMFYSFEEWLTKNKLFYSNGELLCLKCRGHSKISDPTDSEQEKCMRRHITCHVCGGQGTASKQILKKLYLQEKKRFDLSYSKKFRENAIRERALKKLTKKEKEVLGLYG